jgi:hypothetical protein
MIINLHEVKADLFGVQGLACQDSTVPVFVPDGAVNNHYLSRARPVQDCTCSSAAVDPGVTQWLSILCIRAFSLQGPT